MFLDDLIWLLERESVGTRNVNIFPSSSAKIPTGAGPYMTLTETGGSGPEGTHNNTGYQRPAAQVLVRAISYPAARAMSAAAYAALTRVGRQSQSINGVWWRSITLMQEPFDMGVDAVGRAVVVFNISVTKRPDAVTS